MKSVWLTYSWDDNREGDVDFIAQELIRVGLDVKLDKWNLSAGKFLWDQIFSFIQDSKTDGWLFYTTQSGLGSQACMRELEYALDRALQTRGKEFPIIALFPASTDMNLIPVCTKERLCVSLKDFQWNERVLASIEKRIPNIPKIQIFPFAFTVHTPHQKENYSYVIELRPRGGTWSPFFVAIPSSEKESVCLEFGFGAKNHIPENIALQGRKLGISIDGKFLFYRAENEATPTMSYYVYCKKLPSTLIFGVVGGPHYEISLDPNGDPPRFPTT